ncbi:MAG: hypothetical protein AB7F64_06990 [Gammaproteobacteria bacterium]
MRFKRHLRYLNHEIYEVDNDIGERYIDDFEIYNCTAVERNSFEDESSSCCIFSGIFSLF